MRLVATAVAVAREVGLARRLIGRRDRLDGPDFSGTCIALNTMVSHVKNVWDVEFLFAGVLARLGAEVHVVVDDGAMEHLDSVQFRRDQPIPREALNPNCQPRLRNKGRVIELASRFALGHDRIRIHRTSEFLGSTSAVPHPTELRSESFAKDAVSSSKRFFQSGVLDLGDRAHRAYFELSLRNAYRSKQVGRFLVEELGIDLLLTSHGIYSTWAPAADHVRASGGRVLVQGVHPYTRQSVLLSEQPLQLTDIDQDLEWYWARPLPPEDAEEVERYFEERIQHRAHDTSVYHRDAVPWHHPSGGDTKWFGAFPNVVWDGDIEERNTLFPGMFAWLRETARFFMERSEHHLVIRFHPAEATLEVDSVPLQRLLELAVPGIGASPHVHLIPSDQRVDTYALIRDDLDVALVYDGMVALEAAAMGVPTLLCGRGRYSGRKACLEPATLPGYFEILKSPDAPLASWDRATRRAAALKLVRWLVTESAYTMPTIRPDVVISSIAKRVSDLSLFTAEHVAQLSCGQGFGRTISKVYRTVRAEPVPVRGSGRAFLSSLADLPR